MERVDRYRDLVGRLIRAHSGRFLVRLQPVIPHPAMPKIRYLTVIEFPSERRLSEALRSRDYLDAADMNAGYGEFRLWMAEGIRN